jgi:hypothetical protein
MRAKYLSWFISSYAVFFVVFSLVLMPLARRYQPSFWVFVTVCFAHALMSLVIGVHTWNRLAQYLQLEESLKFHAPASEGRNRPLWPTRFSVGLRGQ